MCDNIPVEIILRKSNFSLARQQEIPQNKALILLKHVGTLGLSLVPPIDRHAQDSLVVREDSNVASLQSFAGIAVFAPVVKNSCL